MTDVVALTSPSCGGRLQITQDVDRRACGPYVNSPLERAIAFAVKAHAGQVDRGGAPYILHPLGIMLRLSTTDERITAVLHDVVEDSEVSLDGLRAEGFSEIVIEAIDAVTKRPGEEYEALVLRAASNPIGRAVKLADLGVNSDLSRIANPTGEDYERAAKYYRAIAAIRELEARVAVQPGHSAG